MFGDIDAAEDLAQDALLAALEQWPRDGVPPNAGAWLMLTAKHQAIDRHRRDVTFRRKLSVLGGELLIEDAEQPLPASVDPDFAIEMTCCGWCSPPVIRPSYRRRAWR
jgi:predicted RNA polymerase sigma factor